jgi:hypothetical protein
MIPFPWGTELVARNVAAVAVVVVDVVVGFARETGDEPCGAASGRAGHLTSRRPDGGRGEADGRV